MAKTEKSQLLLTHKRQLSYFVLCCLILFTGCQILGNLVICPHTKPTYSYIKAATTSTSTQPQLPSKIQNHQRKQLSSLVINMNTTAIYLTVMMCALMCSSAVATSWRNVFNKLEGIQTQGLTITNTPYLRCLSRTGNSDPECTDNIQVSLK